MFAVLDRYLVTEILKTMFSILLVLTLIVVVHNFTQLMEKGAAGSISHEVIFTLLGLELTKEMGLLLPPTFFFGVLMTLGRMYRDSEMTALFAGGVGRMRIFRAYAWVIVPIILLTSGMTLMAKPWAHKLLKEIESEQDESADVLNISAGKFNESSKGDLIFYLEELSQERTLMRNIFVQHRDQSGLGIVRASKGYQYTDNQSGDVFIVMQDGYRYDGEPGNHDYRISRFEKYGVRISESDESQVQMVPKLRTSMELLTSDQLMDKVELQLRLSAPLAVLVFAVLSIPLSRASPRQGMAGRMVLALLVYFFFSNLQALSGSWMLSGVTPYWLGRWWVHLLMLALAGLLILIDSLWFAAKLRELRLRLWLGKR